MDGLHLRSSLPRERLAELHGNCFAERCGRCGRQYVRDFEMDTVGFKHTGRRCNDCGGRLKDHILDWCALTPLRPVCAGLPLSPTLDVLVRIDLVLSEAIPQSRAWLGC